MPVYEYRCTPGDSKDGLGEPHCEIFRAKNDDAVRKRIAKRKKKHSTLGGFITEEFLFRGSMVTVKRKMFRPRKEIAL